MQFIIIIIAIITFFQGKNSPSMNACMRAEVKLNFSEIQGEFASCSI